MQTWFNLSLGLLSGIKAKKSCQFSILLYNVNPRKIWGWKFQAKTKMNSQARVQSEINLHKPRKKGG
jgi:hypothetical protein